MAGSCFPSRKRAYMLAYGGICRKSRLTSESPRESALRASTFCQREMSFLLPRKWIIPLILPNTLRIQFLSLWEGLSPYQDDTSRRCFDLLRHRRHLFCDLDIGVGSCGWSDASWEEVSVEEWVVAECVEVDDSCVGEGDCGRVGGASGGCVGEVV